MGILVGNNAPTSGVGDVLQRVEERTTGWRGPCALRRGRHRNTMPRPLRLSLDVLPAPGSRRGRAVIVFALAAAVYGNSLWGDLIFDDQVAVANNADVTSANATDWAGIFAHDFWGGELRDAASHKSYRPL